MTCNNATSNMQPATCKQQHATSNMQPATCNQQRATSNVQPATCNQQHATSNMQPATCNQQHATSNMQSATCNPGFQLAFHHPSVGGGGGIAKCGHPDHFLTHNSNPKIQEITENLRPGEQPQHSLNLVTTVYILHFKQLLKDIKERHVLGLPVAHVYVIEFQKHGLPNSYMLIVLCYTAATQQQGIRQGKTVTKNVIYHAVLQSS